MEFTGPAIDVLGAFRLPTSTLETGGVWRAVLARGEWLSDCVGTGATEQDALHALRVAVEGRLTSRAAQHAQHAREEQYKVVSG